MPIYEYICEQSHTQEIIRKWAERDECPVCSVCGAVTVRLLPLPSRRPDGIYSYAENIGRPFEKRQQAIEDTGRP